MPGQPKGFDAWMKECDRILAGVMEGMTTMDMPDAEWRNYFDGEMSPSEALMTAAEDYWDLPEDILDYLSEKLGLQV